jgi:MarR family transcriptional regulator for hemolysin
MTEGDAELDFQSWAANFEDFYGSGTRLELEYRFTRQTVLAARKWTSYIDQTIRNATGHSRAQWQTLFTLAFVDEPTPTLELSQRVGVRWPTLIRTLNELEEQGMITRTQSRTDGRSRLVHITAQGRDVVAKVKQVLDPTRMELLRPISDEELEVAERVLKKFHALVIARR